MAPSRRRYTGYGQLCPVAKASELIAERWTPVIVRELLYENRRFSELRRGIPLITPAMLTRRLRELEDAGVLERTPSNEYVLTAAGRELAPIIDELGRWGHRFAMHDLRRDDLDAPQLMWMARRFLDVDLLKPPATPTVLAYELVDAPANKRRWWLVVADNDVDLCVKHPGHDVALTVRMRMATFAAVWLGRVSPNAAVRGGSIELVGSKLLAKRFPEWCPRSPRVRQVIALELKRDRRDSKRQST
jgi:DNA-binding HxlR family transcriptional regulator